MEYSNGDGICVGIVKNAPNSAKEKADVISMILVKHNKKLVSEARYFTPDEAMALSIGLAKAVDIVMGKYYIDFRKEKNK